MNLANTLKFKFPKIDLLNQVKLRDDGQGPYIELWDISLGDLPSKEDLDAWALEAQANQKATEYKRLRAAAYPSIAEQLDTLYHEGLDGWKAKIRAIKDKHPKPE